MDIRRVHRVSGVTIAIFIVAHLINHLAIFGGEEIHITLMDSLRVIYRNPIVESVLLLVVIAQVISGLKLFSQIRKSRKRTVDKLQIYSGLYLSFFLIAHVSAVLVGRSVLSLDTNLYFGAIRKNERYNPE